MELPKDLYQILGVAKTATDEEISKAYRKLAKQFHPDLNPGNKDAEERFKEVAAAFAILGDKDKRKRYDNGEIDASGAEMPERQFYRTYADTDAHHHYHSTGGYEDFVDLGDLFAEAFMHGRDRDATGQRPSMPFPGADVRYHLTIEFMEAVNGATKRVTMPGDVTLDVSIPAGIETGQVLRLQGKGRPGFNGGPPGDALVAIDIRSHPLFRRAGNDIHIDLPIALHEAVLGGKVEVPTIAGKVSMTIPRGATSGQTMRLRGRGVKTAKTTGDQLVRLTIAMPKQVDKDLEDFMQSWVKSHDYNPREGMERAV
jgi:DnaJ-class molecular chaperone